MFAEADPTSIGQLVLNITAILVMIGAAVKLLVRKPPLEAEFASKADLKALEHKMEERFSENDVRRERGMGELHEKVNDVRDDVAFIRGIMEADRRSR